MKRTFNLRTTNKYDLTSLIARFCDISLSYHLPSEHCESIMRHKENVECRKNLNTCHGKYFVVVGGARKCRQMSLTLSPSLSLSPCVFLVVVHYVAFAMQMRLCFFPAVVANTTMTATIATSTRLICWCSCCCCFCVAFYFFIADFTVRACVRLAFPFSCLYF